MIDEYKAGQQQAIGAIAQELLKSAMLNETFAHLGNEYLKAWRNTRVGDVAARERLFQAINILDLVKDHLGILAQRGKLATRDLAEIKYLKR